MFGLYHPEEAGPVMLAFSIELVIFATGRVRRLFLPAAEADVSAAYFSECIFNVCFAAQCAICAVNLCDQYHSLFLS